MGGRLEAIWVVVILSIKSNKLRQSGTKNAAKTLKTLFLGIDPARPEQLTVNIMADKVFDPITPWFEALVELGEYIGVRFGRIAPGSEQPEWMFILHTEADGIGGLAKLLRERGATLPRLPHLKYPSEPSWKWFLKMMPAYLKPRHRLKWRPLAKGPEVEASKVPPPAVAWNVFDEPSTTRIRWACRKAGVTVNSFLLKHLNKTIRPYLEDESAVIPWMIPVNLRGKVVRDSDTENFSSYVGVRIRSFETVADVHRSIYRSLASGEHWGNWYAYSAGRFTNPSLKKYLINSDRAMSQWFLGSFSNLGDWDAEKKISEPGCLGNWLFSPPVLACQMIGAGCVTFQNCLSIVIQAHPQLTTSPAVAREWMQNWVKEIDMDLASLLSPQNPYPQAANIHHLAAA